MIYYGDELGVPAAGDPDNRRPLPPPATWDGERRALVTALCALRRDEPALDHGRYVSLAQPGTGVVAFARVTGAARRDADLRRQRDGAPRRRARCSWRCR